MRDFQVLFRESKAEYSLPRKLFLEKEELVRRVAYSRSYNYEFGGRKVVEFCGFRYSYSWVSVGCRHLRIFCGTVTVAN